jgi:hypothetical protein
VAKLIGELKSRMSTVCSSTCATTAAARCPKPPT